MTMKTITFGTALTCFLSLSLCSHAQMTRADLWEDLVGEDGALRYEHPWDADASFRALLEQGRTTPDDLSAVLVEIAETYSTAENRLDYNVGRFARDHLGEYGTPNAIPFLEKTMREDGGSGGTFAAWQLVKMGARHPEALDLVGSILKDKSWPDSGNARMRIYLWVGMMFEGGAPQQDYADRLRAFLLDAAGVETHETEQLDQALCLAIPSYATSRERLRFAERIAAIEKAEGRTDGHFTSLESELRAAGVAEQGD